MSSEAEIAVATESLPTSKPAFLRRVRIRGYKSIAFCDVTLEPLTILVGRNGSGKSNFLDALGFLRDVMKFGTIEAVKRHGGSSAIPCRYSKDGIVSFELECSSKIDGLPSQQIANYRIDIAFSKGQSPRIRHEEYAIATESGVDGFTNVDGTVSFVSALGRIEEELKWPNDRPFLTYPPGEFRGLSELISCMAAYNFSPAMLRQLFQSDYSGFLESDGSNLPGVISEMQFTDSAALDRLGQFLSVIVNEVEGFDVVNYGDYKTIRFRLVAKYPNQRMEFDATAMSDGTLRSLAALVAVYQFVYPYGFPSLVAIEEPETALHPAAMRALVSAMDEATLRTQILLTTHSPDLLDAPDISINNIRVVQMIDGVTVIGPADEASVDIIKQKLSTLGDLERDNQFEPDLGDRERQDMLSTNRIGSTI